ncbi:helix-turn-helix domain-containing protein [Streptomyces armeniacus]|uniref:Helix-turn-helix domain-containing protein n=1 Tax=Streptomyces armeniacus TaxID=83291 RepID=A0A345XRW1_9ACTN|nr:helix-turn-helix domain-containing protein [Streptomyces armeniacus]AXK34377.1 helix-turn-helix domain-containing protein [Streptomyces armeniacus]
MLACAEGTSNRHVAARLGTSVSTVTRWRRRFVESWLEGPTDGLRPGRPLPVLNDRVEAVVVATLETSPPNATHCSRASMALAPVCRGRRSDGPGRSSS